MYSAGLKGVLTSPLGTFLQQVETERSVGHHDTDHTHPDPDSYRRGWIRVRCWAKEHTSCVRCGGHCVLLSKYSTFLKFVNFPKPRKSTPWNTKYHQHLPLPPLPQLFDVMSGWISNNSPTPAIFTTFWRLWKCQFAIFLSSLPFPITTKQNPNFQHERENCAARRPRNIKSYTRNNVTITNIRQYLPNRHPKYQMERECHKHTADEQDRQDMHQKRNIKTKMDQNMVYILTDKALKTS